MDFKNIILGIFFIAAGMVVLFMQSKNIQDLEDVNSSLYPVEDFESAKDEEIIKSSEKLDKVFEPKSDDIAIKSTSIISQKEITTISNKLMSVDFTNQGAAIEKIRFLTTKRGKPDEYIFNQSAEVPSFSLGFDLDGKLNLLDFSYDTYLLDDNKVEFVYSTEEMTIRRIYELEDNNYLISHETIVKNLSSSELSSRDLYLNLGTSFPINDKEMPNYLTVGCFDGKDAKFTAINKLKNKKNIERIGRFNWVSLQNQYFAGILMPETPIKSVDIFPSYSGNDNGISANVFFNLDNIPSNESRSFKNRFYIGPKEFKRLQAFEGYQDKVMQFGWFSFFSKLLLWMMSEIHKFIPNWGWSIVVMTIIIKIIFWPLTAKAVESQKGMSKIQQPMADLKKKYEKNPQKMQQETLKLFKEHGVNPLAGCFPILIQMPIFLGLFYMLRTAAELRYESFLWVNDLSMPDTVAEIFGFPINPFPILMGLTMFFQMQMTPISPTADPVQQKIFKFMPFVFLIFLYSFGSGLVIYWTTQNILTIFQQWITKK